MSSYTIQGSDGQQYGPVDGETLLSWAKEGRLVKNTYVFDHDAQKWIEAGSLPLLTPVWAPPAEPAAPPQADAKPKLKLKAPAETQPAPAPQPAAAPGGLHKCAECGREFPPGEMISFNDKWICAACKPFFFQRLRENPILPGAMDYAGFWIRFVAKFVDGIILNIANFFIGILFGIFMPGLVAPNQKTAGLVAVIVGQLILILAQMVISISYNTFFVGRYGATPGKMACKLKIVRSDGSQVGYARAFGRQFAEMLSGLILCFGYLMVIWDDEKRALHDRICDTRVIRNP
ncbi:MAG: RDD family protein [Verrucomicrobiae bacterium]|nr:RDD family protein [Verrucomicrobiae bacterium]